MRNIYRLERWRYHCCVETMTFTNKKKAKKWLKNSSWWADYDYGECMIYIYINKVRLDYEQVNKEWRFY